MVLGRVNLYDGNYEEAEYYLRKSVNLNPNDTDNLIQVSTCLTMLGYAEEALKLYERAFQLNPVNIQRPESHTYHHARGIHKMNYSDLPLFDILFGTFYNPQKFEYETGFYHGASARIPEMLMFREISGEEGAETVTVRGVAGVEERKVPA